MSLDLPLDSLKLGLASQVDTDEFVALVEDVTIKKDRHGRQMIQLIVYSEKYGRIVIALSPSYINLMVDNLKKLGFTKLGEIVGKEFIFKRVKLPRAKKATQTRTQDLYP